MNFLLKVSVVFAFLCNITSFAQSTAIASKPDAAIKPPQESFHIYLLMGQSNMVGRGTNGIPEQKTNPRILMLDTNGQWLVAKDPLHPKIGRIEPGVGPGMFFANEMIKADSNGTIGLVPCAVGGTPLRRWVKGGDLYENAVKRAKLAAQSGILTGMLWHQGESDSDKKADADSYESRLSQMFKDFRADVGSPNLPIVVGQLGNFLETEKHPFVNTVRGAIQHIAETIPNVGYADSTGLNDKGDKLHFTADAQREFGTRYAQAMQKLQAVSASTVSPAPAAIVDIWPESKMPGHGADGPEALRTPEKTDAKRITNISRPTLTIFPALRKSGAPAPAMIVCPGGGYNYVVVDKEGTDIAAWLNANGISALVLKYRTPNNRAGAFQDVQRALSLTRARAGEWNLDPHRLGIIGFSAGGNLAAKASTRFGERSYPASDAIDEQSCRPDFAVLGYPAYLDDKNGHISPVLVLKANIPPTLIVHSEDDKTFVPGSKLYNSALDQA